jgi:hypothetical protein
MELRHGCVTYWNHENGRLPWATRTLPPSGPIPYATKLEDKSTSSWCPNLF